LIGLGVFAAALAMVIFVFWVTLIPALPRIADLLAYGVELSPQRQPANLGAVVAPIRRKADRMPEPVWRAAA
jgi:hypothetical protein